MTTDKDKIIDNPSNKKLLKTAKELQAFSSILPSLKTLGIKDSQWSEILSQIPDLEKQLETLYIPDKFNEFFAADGWIAYESLNLELMKKSVGFAETGNFEDAENLLVDYYNESNLNFLLNTMKVVKQFHSRYKLSKLAQEDYLAGRYHACVPVLLILIDGLVNDIEPTGFFAEGTSLTAWDSIAAHSSGLQKLSKLFREGRVKTNTDDIKIPYRNGILHGRDLGYANKVVAAKCWAALFAIKDWAIAIKNGKKKPLPEESQQNLMQTLQAYTETKDLQKRIEAWRTREVSLGVDVPTTGLPRDYEDCTPERAMAEFMFYWSNKNYGKMSTLLVDYLNTPIKVKAGVIRKEFDQITLISFQIVGIDDTTPAMTTIAAIVHYDKNSQSKASNIEVHLVYNDEKSQPTLRGESNGKWYIHQRSFNSIIYS